MCLNAVETINYFFFYERMIGFMPYFFAFVRAETEL